MAELLALREGGGAALGGSDRKLSVLDRMLDTIHISATAILAHRYPKEETPPPVCVMAMMCQSPIQCLRDESCSCWNGCFCGGVRAQREASTDQPPVLS